MCRRLIIDVEWDDEEGEEVSQGLFDPATDCMTLTDLAEMILVKELTGLFDGQLTFRIEKMNG